METPPRRTGSPYRGRGRGSPARSFAADASPQSPSRSSPRRGSPKGAGVNPTYTGTHLKAAEEDSFKAAGILPIAFFSTPPADVLSSTAPSTTTSTVDERPVPEAENTIPAGGRPLPYVLLGLEARPGYKGEAYLNLFGGKREQTDKSAAETAWREFWEETGRLLGDEAPVFLEHCKNGGDSRRVLWFSPGKYVVFLHHLSYPPPKWTTQLADMYRKLETREEGSEMDSFHWVAVSDLLAALRPPGLLYSTDGQAYPLFKFGSNILSRLAHYLSQLAHCDPPAIPPVESLSAPPRSGKPSPSRPIAGASAISSTKHTTPEKDSTASTLSEAFSTLRLSADAKPFYPRDRQSPSTTKPAE